MGAVTRLCSRFTGSEKQCCERSLTRELCSTKAIPPRDKVPPFCPMVAVKKLWLRCSPGRLDSFFFVGVAPPSSSPKYTSSAERVSLSLALPNPNMLPREKDALRFGALFFTLTCESRPSTTLFFRCSFPSLPLAAAALRASFFAFLAALAPRPFPCSTSIPFSSRASLTIIFTR